MNRLEEIKNEYAKTYRAKDWEDHTFGMNGKDIEEEMNDVCKIYAKEVAQASLEKASENTIHLLETYNAEHSEIKLEITNSQNIILL